MTSLSSLRRLTEVRWGMPSLAATAAWLGWNDEWLLAKNGLRGEFKECQVPYHLP